MAKELTFSELRMLKFAAQGDMAKEQARKLDRAPKTLQNHWRTVKRKLRARTVTHAVAIAIDQGIIRL